jgi:galactofuranosylgalactofuranosylrhamnosyl-N-acetylglucosaminyl-diphospho-decaprenol beta-1,5/1,6-galactofuranosyltransferase
MLAEATALHLRIYREWDKLAERYRAAVPAITSIAAWKKTFDADPKDDR